MPRLQALPAGQVFNSSTGMQILVIPSQDDHVLEVSVTWRCHGPAKPEWPWVHFRDCGWIVVCGNTLALTRLWQFCLATDAAENSVLQLLSGVENHLMLCMTQDSFLFFHPWPCPHAGIPNSYYLPHKTGLLPQPFSGWRPNTSVSPRWTLSRLHSLLMALCALCSHSPALGDWWASWGGSPVLHSRFPSYDFIVTPLGGGGGRNITPSVPWDARQITRSICRSHMKGTGETARAQGSVMWRWLRLEVLDPRFSLMIEYHMHLELNLYLL